MIRIFSRLSTDIVGSEQRLYQVMVAQYPNNVRATSYSKREIEYWASGFQNAIETTIGLKLPITYDEESSSPDVDAPSRAYQDRKQSINGATVRLSETSWVHVGYEERSHDPSLPGCQFVVVFDDGSHRILSRVELAMLHAAVGTLLR